MRYVADPDERPPRFNSRTLVASARDAVCLAAQMSADYAAHEKLEPEPEPNDGEADGIR